METSNPMQSMCHDTARFLADLSKEYADWARNLHTLSVGKTDAKSVQRTFDADVARQIAVILRNAADDVLEATS